MEKRGDRKDLLHVFIQLIGKFSIPREYDSREWFRKIFDRDSTCEIRG